MNNGLEVNFDNINILWHLGFYDGMTSGVLSYYNELYYFKMIEEFIFNDDLSRRFVCIKLTQQEQSKLTISHLDFQNFVGNHTDYINNKRVSPGRLSPKENWSNFYDNFDRRESLKVDFASIVERTPNFYFTL